MGIDIGVLVEGSIHDSDIENRNWVVFKESSEVSQDCRNLGINFLENDKVVSKSIVKILNNDF